MPLNSGQMISKSINHYLWWGQSHLFPGKDHSAQLGQGAGPSCFLFWNSLWYPEGILHIFSVSKQRLQYLSEEFYICQFPEDLLMKCNLHSCGFASCDLQICWGFYPNITLFIISRLCIQNGSMEVPGLAGEWLVFKYSIPVKDGLQRLHQ